MTPSEAFKAIDDAKSALVEHCSIECAWYDFVDERESYWTLNGTSDVSFSKDRAGADPDDPEYGNEIIRDKVWRGAEVTAMLVSNGCGDTYIQFFDNAKEVK